MATKRRGSRKQSKIVESISYKEQEIKIVDEGNGPELMLGDEKLDCKRDDVSGAYSSCLFPYQTFGSPQEIAKALIDSK